MDDAAIAAEIQFMKATETVASAGILIFLGCSAMVKLLVMARTRCRAGLLQMFFTVVEIAAMASGSGAAGRRDMTTWCASLMRRVEAPG